MAQIFSWHHFWSSEKKKDQKRWVPVQQEGGKPHAGSLLPALELQILCQSRVKQRSNGGSPNTCSVRLQVHDDDEDHSDSAFFKAPCSYGISIKLSSSQEINKIDQTWENWKKLEITYWNGIQTVEWLQQMCISLLVQEDSTELEKA